MEKEKSVFALGQFATFFIWSVTSIASTKAFLTAEAGLGGWLKDTVIAWVVSYIIARVFWLWWRADDLETENQQLINKALKHYAETKGIK
jgi:hypothetical protein